MLFGGVEESSSLRIEKFSGSARSKIDAMTPTRPKAKRRPKPRLFQCVGGGERRKNDGDEKKGEPGETTT